jgi:hypothetical protein
MHLGLDVGTAATKLTRYQGSARVAPRMLMVPTAVAYRGLVSHIPALIPGEETLEGEVRCDGFPAMLGIWPPERVAAWGGRMPDEVTQSFLRLLLNRAGDQQAPLVVAVPPAGPEATGRGGERGGGTGLAGIFRALGRPPLRVLPAPIAALAYLRRGRPELAAVTRFAVCDIGAGGVSLALCAATGDGARIVDAIRMTGAAAWGGDTVPGPAAEGRPATLAEFLVAEIARLGGAPAAAPGGERSVYRWRTLEAVLSNLEEEDSPGHELQRVFGASGRQPAFGVLRFADIEVRVSQLLDACAPLADNAGAALARLLARQADPGWRHFGAGQAPRVMMIGGLAGLRPIQVSLLRAAGLDPYDPGDAVVRTDAEDRLGAAARGAALVAAGQADPSVRFPCALRLPVHRQVRGRIMVSYLELAAAGSIAPDQAETPVTGTDGRPVEVTVPASREPVPLAEALPVQVVPGDGAAPVAAEFHPAHPPPAGDYLVSVSGDPAGAAIVLRSVETDRKLRYVLRQPPSQASGTE